MQVFWWSIGESNPWPPQCECRALTRQGHIRPRGIQMTARSPSWKWFGLVEIFDSDVLLVMQAYFQRADVLLRQNPPMK